jgi:hypothetical protein
MFVYYSYSFTRQDLYQFYLQAKGNHSCFASACTCEFTWAHDWISIFHPIIITHYSIYIFARCLSRLSHMMFSIKNTYHVCMIYCNSVLWFINTAFVPYDFIKCFMYYIIDIWMPVATHGHFASNLKKMKNLFEHRAKDP